MKRLLFGTLFLALSVAAFPDSTTTIDFGNSSTPPPEFTDVGNFYQSQGVNFGNALELYPGDGAYTNTLYGVTGDDATQAVSAVFSIPQYSASITYGAECPTATACNDFEVTVYGPGHTLEDTLFYAGSTSATPTFQTISFGETTGFSELDFTTTVSGDPSDNMEVTQVMTATPEPGSLLLISSGLLGAIGVARRKFGL